MSINLLRKRGDTHQKEKEITEKRRKQSRYEQHDVITKRMKRLF